MMWFHSIFKLHLAYSFHIWMIEVVLMGFSNPRKWNMNLFVIIYVNYWLIVRFVWFLFKSNIHGDNLGVFNSKNHGTNFWWIKCCYNIVFKLRWWFLFQNLSHIVNHAWIWYLLSFIKVRMNTWTHIMSG